MTPLRLSPAVASALERGAPVVALESTLICHGFARPDNLAVARALEATVREAGAVPATVAVLDCAVRVGLRDDELERLALQEEAEKCSTRDLPAVLAARRSGATTVAATIFVAARAGLAVMATGGIGGVHRAPGGEAPSDVSADLCELARSPVAVVCSGTKAILDLPRTSEVLETLGVPVVGYRCDELPAFYSATSGLPLPHRVGDVAALARVVVAHRALGVPAGMLVCNPPPPEVALPRAEVERLVAEAESAAARAGVTGKALTPFLLDALARLSGGRTVATNRALVLANAGLAAELASALAA